LGHLWTRLNHKILDVDLLRLRVYLISATKSDPDPGVIQVPYYFPSPLLLLFSESVKSWGRTLPDFRLNQPGVFRRSSGRPKPWRIGPFFFYHVSEWMKRGIIPDAGLI